MDVAGAVEGVDGFVAVTGMVFCKADAEVTLVDEVVGSEAVCESAPVGSCRWVPARAVGGVTLNVEAQAAELRRVRAVLESVERMVEEVGGDFAGGVKAAGFEFAVGVIFEYTPLWRSPGDGVVDSCGVKFVNLSRSAIDFVRIDVSVHSEPVGRFVNGIVDSTSLFDEIEWFTICGGQRRCFSLSTALGRFSSRSRCPFAS